VIAAIGLCSLATAAAFTIWAMLHGAGGVFEWSWFYPWALSPYIVLGILCITSATRAAATRRAALVAAVLVSIVSAHAYVNAMFFDVSSTSALIFIFMPLYSLIGGLVVYGVVAVVGRWLRAANDT